MTFTIASGQAFTVPMSDIAAVAVDARTQVFYLPNYVELVTPPVADQSCADPARVIRRGDSGGGAFLGRKLIGNTWAIYVDPDDKQPLGKFNVALLPAEAMVLLRPEQMTVAAVSLPGATSANGKAQ